MPGDLGFQVSGMRLQPSFNSTPTSKPSIATTIPGTRRGGSGEEPAGALGKIMVIGTDGSLVPPGDLIYQAGEMTGTRGFIPPS